MPNPDQLPPHSLADEQGVIACCIEDAANCLPECHGVTEGHFYDARNKTLWRCLSALEKEGVRVDQISVSRRLTQEGLPQLANEYVAEILNAIPSALNLQHYLPSLHDFAVKRQVMRGCAELNTLASGGISAGELLAKAENLLSFERPQSRQVLDGKKAAAMMIDDLQRRHELQGALPGLPTGLEELDAKLDGLQYGEQTLIGARPSQGKTALGLGVFAHCVFELKEPALFVSLEMSAAALMRRMLASRAAMSMGTIRRGTYSHGDFQRFTQFQLAAAKAPMAILDGVSGLGISEICVLVRRHVRQAKSKLVVVDYLQKVKPSERHEKRTYEVGEVSGRLKALAVETGAAFLTLAQINRESEKQKGGKVSGIPKLSDLADSGQIERDADTVVLIHRDKADETGLAHLIVAKQRDGETGIVKTKFNGSLCRFESWPKITHDDELNRADYD